MCLEFYFQDIFGEAGTNVWPSSLGPALTVGNALLKMWNKIIFA